MATPTDSDRAAPAGWPAVSVVIPTNRGGPYLAQAVESVRAQSVPVYEIVLVDDGSPAPGLASVARGLGVAYVRQTSSGISVARNAGVATSTGRWIAFLDDDDIWHPLRIQRQLEALARQRGAIGSFTGGWYMDSEGRRFGTDWSGRPASAAQMLAGAVNFPRITTLLVARTAYTAVGGCDRHFEPSEDNELLLRLLQIGEFVGVDEPLVGYRRHSANVTSRTLKGRIASRRAIVSQLGAARRRNDAPLAAMLAENLRVFRRNAAAENLGDLIDSARKREWRYTFGVAAWGALCLPVESVAAVRDRLDRRRGR